jgi:hypothetical protein
MVLKSLEPFEGEHGTCDHFTNGLHQDCIASDLVPMFVQLYVQIPGRAVE